MPAISSNAPSICDAAAAIVILEREKQQMKWGSSMYRRVVGIVAGLIPALALAVPVQYACSNDRFKARLVLDTETLDFELYRSDGVLVAKPDEQNHQRQKSTEEDGSTVYAFGGFDITTFFIAVKPDGNIKLTAVDNETRAVDYKLKCQALEAKDDM